MADRSTSSPWVGLGILAIMVAGGWLFFERADERPRSTIFLEGDFVSATIERDDQDVATAATLELSNLSGPVADSRRVSVTVPANELECGPYDIIHPSEFEAELGGLKPGDPIAFGWDLRVDGASDPPSVASATVRIPCD